MPCEAKRTIWIFESRVMHLLNKILSYTWACVIKKKILTVSPDLIFHCRKKLGKHPFISIITFQYRDNTKVGRHCMWIPGPVHQHSPTIWPLTVSLSLGLSLFKSSLWSVERERQRDRERELQNREYIHYFTFNSRHIAKLLGVSFGIIVKFGSTPYTLMWIYLTSTSFTSFKATCAFTHFQGHFHFHSCEDGSMNCHRCWWIKWSKTRQKLSKIK